MAVAGVEIAFADAPAMGPHRQVYVGLANTAFKHEEPGWRPSPLSGGPAIYQHVIDKVEEAIARLDQLAREERRRRRNPLYWIDRGIRYVLAIPAYIVSRIIGVPVIEIDRSSWGLLLRVIGVVADGIGIYLGGRALGLW